VDESGRIFSALLQGPRVPEQRGRGNDLGYVIAHAARLDYPRFVARQFPTLNVFLIIDLTLRRNHCLPLYLAYPHLLQ